MTDSTILVEVCCGSLLDCQRAEAAGAGRVELNSALPLGGLTPSNALVAKCLQEIRLPIIVMVRPRPGDFCYSDSEVDLLTEELCQLAELGAAGAAWGITDQQHQVCVPKLERVFDQIKPRFPEFEMVYHRAIDLSPDWRSAFARLVELGFDRVLSSGLAETASAGVDTLKSMVEEFGDRIDVLPGSGINSENVVDIVRRSGCRSVHGSFSSTVSECNTPIAGFGAVSAADPLKLSATISALRAVAE